MVKKIKLKTYFSDISLNIENLKQFSKENTTKLFQNLKTKNATTDKYSLIYVLIINK